MRAFVLLVAAAASSGFGAAASAAPAGPNILWISAEDISADTLGCYGGSAHTPRLDALAAGGVRFDAAFAAAPVCAPSRSGIITGMMPTTLGSLPMRCLATAPPHVVGFPRLLREAGSFCTNNSKTDYNLGRGFDAGWNESGGAAHWRLRPDSDQPFFAVFNLVVTHESGLFADAGRRAKLRSGLPAAARRDPATVRVPPWYPDTPVIRADLAHRQELAAALDARVGKILDELAADGLADDTLVCFWGDHGEGIPHGKRFLNEHGLRVPLIVHVPPRWRDRLLLAGGRVAVGVAADPVSLVDLGPTMLDVAGVPIPEWMEGRSRLGPHAVAGDLVVGARDRMECRPGCGRTVRDARFRYVRNFFPWLDGDDLPGYAEGVPITAELRTRRSAGELPATATWFTRTSRPPEELFDITTGRDDCDDLAGDPVHAADLRRLRERLRDWMLQSRDTGLVPEAILRREAAQAGSEWAIFHPAEPAAAAAAVSRHAAILEVAWDVSDGREAAAFHDRLSHEDPVVRVWAVRGVGWWASRQEGAAAERTAAVLEPLLADRDPVVRIEAARWMAATLPHDPASQTLAVLRREIRSSDPETRCAALAAIDALEARGLPLAADVEALEILPTKGSPVLDNTACLVKRILARTP